MVREVFAACLRVSDGVCPEAYNLLALKTSSSLDEALALYNRAESLCPLLDEEFESICRSSSNFSHPLPYSPAATCNMI